MRYLVHAKLKQEKAAELLEAIEDRSLGRGSVAFGEYVRNMRRARRMADGSLRWVEVCYCREPLEEELPYWEQYFELTKIMNAHARSNCRDLNGEEPWACSNCDCSARLEAVMESWGERFLDRLRQSEQP